MNAPARRIGLVGTLVRAAVVGAASAGYAVFRYRAWDRSFTVPLATAGTDHLFIASMVRSIHDSGWYFTNDHLGAPFGQQLYDFPHAGESLQLLVIRVLTLFSVRPFWVMNVYYLIGFGATAFVTYLVLSHLRFSPRVSAAIALLFTWLPFHFMHGEFHLFRSTYLSVPLGVLVIFWVLSWKDRFLVDAEGAVWGPKRLVANLRWPRVCGALALCAFIGVWETMVMAFVLLALMVSAAVAAARNRDVGDLAVASAAGLVIASSFAIAFIPNLMFKVDNGPNTQAGARYPSEQITLGLQPAKLVFPVATHHIGPLGRLMPRSQAELVSPNPDGQNLGTLGAIGLLVLLYGVVANRLDTRIGTEVWARRRLWVQSGLVTLVLILFGTAGGFALVLSTLGLSQIRVWDRVSIVIAFCAYLMVAIGLERASVWIGRRVTLRSTPDVPHDLTASVTSIPAGGAHTSGRRRLASVLGVTLLVVVVGFGLWDTDSSYSTGAFNAGRDRSAQAMIRFVAATASAVGPEAKIFQVPVVPFPENPPVADMHDYEGLLPYVFAVDPASRGLSFSYGATKGRPDADWQPRIVDADPRWWLAAIQGLGFDAVLLDTHGFDDGGEALSWRLSTVLGPPVVSSRTDRWRVWDLRGFAETQGLSDADLRRAALDLVGPNLMARADPASVRPVGKVS